MVVLSRKAREHLQALIAHYEASGRIAATRNLLQALEAAKARIEANPEIGGSAPRPYPTLRRQGALWLKSGRYWIAYTPSPKVIVLIFYETADIPGRL